MKPTYTTQNVLRMILDDLRGSHMFSDDFIIFSVFSGCSPKKKHLKVPEFCRSDFGYLWLFLSDPCRGSDLETAFYVLLLLLFLLLLFHL